MGHVHDLWPRQIENFHSAHSDCIWDIRLHSVHVHRTHSSGILVYMCIYRAVYSYLSLRSEKVERTVIVMGMGTVNWDEYGFHIPTYIIIKYNVKVRKKSRSHDLWIFYLDWRLIRTEKEKQILQAQSWHWLLKRQRS